MQEVYRQGKGPEAVLNCRKNPKKHEQKEKSSIQRTPSEEQEKTWAPKKEVDETGDK